MSYPVYSKYKDTEISWIGSIPSEWRMTKVKFSTYVKGRIGWQGLRSEDFIDEGPYCVTGTDFKKGVIDWKSCYRVDNKRYEMDRFIQLRENDLLITKDGTIGKIALVKGLSGKATLNSGVFVTRPKKNEYKNEYFYWLLNSSIFDEFIKFISSGSTIKHLYQNTFDTFSFPVPSKQEQVFITKFLDFNISEVDHLIEKNEQLISLLHEKQKAMISHAVTKGLDPNASMRDSGIEWLGDIPEHWKTSSIKHLCSLIKDGTHNPPTRVDDGIPLLSVRNIINSEFVFREDDSMISEKAYKELARSFTVNRGDVLLAIVGGTIGKAAVVEDMDKKFHIQRSVAVFRTKDKKVLNHYLFNAFLTDGFQKLLWQNVGFSAQPGIYLGALGNFKVPLPPLKEQLEIIESLDESISKFDILINKSKLKIERLKEHRSALISAAVTGRIDVREWNNKEKAA